jgi:hypothetical protein
MTAPAISRKNVLDLSQGKRSDQYDHLEDVHPREGHERLEQQRGRNGGEKKNHCGVFLDPGETFVGDERGPLGALDQDEVGDGRQRHSTP